MGNGFNPAPEQPLWPELLRHAGYRTFGTGKWHNGKPAFSRCFDDGAAIFFGGMHDPVRGGHWRPAVWEFDPSGEYPTELRRSVEGFSSSLFADAAIQFLDDVSQVAEGQPFLAYVSFTAPHDPRHAPEWSADMYADTPVHLPPNYLPQHPFDNGELGVRDERLAPRPLTESIARHHLVQYYAMITQMDREIGRILAALDDHGLRDNTVIIFTSDHGLAVGQHGLLGKQNLYEHSVRAPLLFSGKHIPAGSQSHALCYLHDIGPTILSLTGVDIPKAIDGRSLTPVLHDPGADLRSAVRLRYRHFQRAVCEARYKLIQYRIDGDERLQLFDLERDPFEMNNLAGDPEYAAVIDRLRAQLPPWLPE